MNSSDECLIVYSHQCGASSGPFQVPAGPFVITKYNWEKFKDVCESYLNYKEYFDYDSGWGGGVCLGFSEIPGKCEIVKENPTQTEIDLVNKMGEIQDKRDYELTFPEIIKHVLEVGREQGFFEDEESGACRVGSDGDSERGFASGREASPQRRETEDPDDPMDTSEDPLFPEDNEIEPYINVQEILHQIIDDQIEEYNDMEDLD